MVSTGKGFRFLFEQQYDPIAFLIAQRSYPGSIWWSAWGLRAVVVVGVILALGLVTAYRGREWLTAIAFGLLAWVILQLVGAIAVMVTHQFQFWQLYATSPAALLITFLAGMSAVWPTWQIIGWGLGLPFLLGVMTADAGSLWIWKRIEEVERERHRRREAGPEADLPTLGWWTLVRRCRLILAIIFIGAGVVLPTTVGDALSPWLFFFLTCAVGCLRMEASLLAWVARISPVRYDPVQDCWQPTYVGRMAIFLPKKQVVNLIQSASTPARASAALLTLFGQGALGPVIRLAFCQLSPELIVMLACYLSLQPGGAAVIRYLRQGLPDSLKPSLGLYAALAEEAAKPFDLQRWLLLLSEQIPDKVKSAMNEESNEEIELRTTLECAQAAFSTSTHCSDLALALQHLERLVRRLYDLPPAEADADWGVTLNHLPRSWPVALTLHLTLHSRHLHNP